MKLLTLTKANRDALPPLYTNESLDDANNAVAYVKIFHPNSRYTFYVTEFDGDDTLFGYCVSPLGPDCDEWGYASLKELTELRAGPFKLPLERDLYFTPATVAECLASA
jgi:hypothetical protein